MRHRNLAAIAATATVAATSAVTAVIEDVTTAPPAAAQENGGLGFSMGGCAVLSPRLNGNPGVVWVETVAYCLKPSTFSLQASVDHSHWKTLRQIHVDSDGNGNWASGPCLAGTWWYQSYLVADDGSFKGGTDSLAPTQFTC